MATYKLRFWYWHQEVVITGITADELVHSLFFPNNVEMKDFYRIAYLEGENGPYPIDVTFHDLEHLYISHLKRDDLESIDTSFRERARVELGDDFWILEEDTSEKEKQDEKEFSKD